MIEATLTLAALIPLAGFAGWRVGEFVGYRKACGHLETAWIVAPERPTADDYRNRAERAEAALAEALAELAKYKLPRNAKGRFVRREP